MHRLEHAPDLAVRHESIVQVQAEIHCLLVAYTALGQMPQRYQCLLEAGGGLAIGATGGRLAAGLAVEDHRLVPEPTIEGVVGETIHPLGQPPRRHPLDHGDEAGVEGAAMTVQERAVGDLVGQGVLESVFEIGKEARLVEELGGLQMGEALAQLLFGRVLDRLKERERHVLADDGGGLQETLLPRG